MCTLTKQIVREILLTVLLFPSAGGSDRKEREGGVRSGVEVAALGDGMEM